MRICVNVFTYFVCSVCQACCADFPLGTTPTLSFQVPLLAHNTKMLSHDKMAAPVRLTECCVYVETENSFVIASRSINFIA
jgi:hypothetical protein